MKPIASAVVVREARAEDASALYPAWLDVRRHYALVDSRIIPAPVSADEFAISLAERIARPEAATFIAMAGPRVVGFITGGIEPGQPDRLPDRHATIGHLFVDAHHRRQGIGQRLFRALAEWAQAQGEIGHFEMTVLDADESARQFWAAIGFRPFIQRLWAPLEAPDERP
jgi:GNAT superfamily N-acetyltransferase